MRKAKASPFRVEWEELVALEPSAVEVAAHAPVLAAAYNDPHNAALMGHTREMSEVDVAQHFASVEHPFLLFCDGVLAGDADLRDLEHGGAEFAFMIAAKESQGRGLGTRFALMVHALAFGSLGLERVYAAVVPANTASARVFEKLGYTVDASPAARARADDEADVVWSIGRREFEGRNATAIAGIRVISRG